MARRVWLAGDSAGTLCIPLIIDFLGYILWAITTVMEGAEGRFRNVLIARGVLHSDHEWGQGACLGGCGLLGTG